MNVADSYARCFLKRKYYIANKFQQFEIYKLYHLGLILYLETRLKITKVSEFIRILIISLVNI